MGQLLQVQATPEEYFKVGLILLGIVAGVWGIVKCWLAIDSRWVRRSDYERDTQERDHRVHTDIQREKKFSKQIDRLIEAIKNKK